MLATLRFKSSYADVELTITHKYAFIDGDSGVGKSFLIDQFIEAKRQSSYGYFETSVPHIILERDPNKEYLISAYKVSKKPLMLICDEQNAHMVVDVAKIRNICCVVITREMEQPATEFSDGQVPYSYKCFYSLRRVNGITTLHRKYVDFPHCTERPFDYFYTEDSGYGNHFMRRLLGTDVSSTKGKTNIISTLEDSGIDSSVNVGLLLDGGNIGFENPTLRNYIKGYGLNVTIFDPECFEQLLYESPMLSPRQSVGQEYCSQSPSTEVFCEQRLLHKTKNQPYICDHDHNEMSPCWYTDCIHPTPCTQYSADTINSCVFGDKPLCTSFTYKYKMEYVLAGDRDCPLPELLDIKFSRKYPSMRVDHSIKYNHIALCHLLNLAVERAHSWMHIVDAGEDYMELGTVVPIPCYGAFFTTEEYAVLFGKDYDSFPTDLFLIDVYRNHLFPIYVDGAFIPQSGYSYNELLRISKNYPTIVI